VNFLKLRIGGQAFGNGVLMRSKRYWALAREDGSLEFGLITSWLDHHPKFNIFLLRSIIYFCEMLWFGLRILRRNPLQAERRLLKWLFIYLAITIPISIYFKELITSYFALSVLFQLFIFLTALWAISRGMTPKVWSYHGAEHKTVHAYEEGRNLNNVQEIMACSRIHPRCGTNLVFLIAVLSSIYFPVPVSQFTLLTSALYTTFTVALSIEIFKQLIRFPKSILSRVLLFGGNQLQRWVTTREPTSEQIKLASKALRMVLILEALGK
jgi:uncharacterized protein YqhQ